MLDVIIRNGQVVTPQAVGRLDVGIQGEHIVAVGQPGTLSGEVKRVIDASGKIVIPGGIEPHAHIGIPVPPDWTGPRRCHDPAAGGCQPGGRVWRGDDDY